MGKQPAMKWDLALNEGIPMRLDIRTGVGETRIDLEHVLATNVEVKTGVGKTDLTLPATGDVKVALSGGIGETTIHIPKGVAARIRTKTGIGSVKVYGDYDRINDEYVSPGFNSAENRVDLEVKGGIGSIAIQGQ
jgi:predicted membrane protein